LSIRSPSVASSAGRKVTEPTIATATTIIVPIANEANVTLPVSSIPAIAIITVIPDTSTARPEVAAARASACADEAPALRSSRARRI
jgi:hypothetical protein